MTSDAEQLRRNFVNAKWRLKCGVGVPTGAVNGIFDIEGDTIKGHGVDGLASIEALEAKHGRLPDTLMAESPTGSVHRIYRHPGRGIKIKSSDSKIAPGVDIKGDGGMFVAPPSRRKDGVYRWRNNLPVADAPAWLIELVRDDAPERSNGGEKDPYKLFADEVRGKIPLDKLTFMLMQVIPNTVEKGRAHWIKVGHALKHERPDDDGKKLWLEFSEKWDGVFDDEKFNTDEKTREKYLIKTWNGLKPDHITGGSIYWLCDAADPDWRDKYEAEAAEQQVAEQSAPDKQEAEPPVDLWGHFDPPALPHGLLPGVIEQFALVQGELMGADPAGLAVAALVICGAVISDEIKLQVKRHSKGWDEEARLWAGLVGNPSTMKSPIMRAAAKPLEEIDARLWREYLAAKAEYDRLSPEEKKEEDPPKREHLRLEDTTIEAAQDAMRENPKGILCLQDELSGWFGSMEKYSAAKGAQKDRGFWLRTWNGGNLSVDRVMRGSFMIENIGASVLGGVQPDVIRKIAGETYDDGLIQRLLPIVLREATLGHDEPTPPVVEEYAKLIERLHQLTPELNQYQSLSILRA